MFNIIVYWWGDKYPLYYVERLRAGVKRNLSFPHRFIVMTDQPRSMPNLDIEQIRIPDADMAYTRMKGCFARLRLFDPVFQRLNSLYGRIVSMDLDMVITGSIDEVLNKQEEFSILQGINGNNPCPFNGSLWMLSAGIRPDVWREFSPSAYHHYKVPYYAFPDDQGWLSFKFKTAGYFGPSNGVYAYMKRGWSPDKPLPDNARIVAFPGFRDPSMFEHIDWVKKHWRV